MKKIIFLIIIFLSLTSCNYYFPDKEYDKCIIWSNTKTISGRRWRQPSNKPYILDVLYVNKKYKDGDRIGSCHYGRNASEHKNIFLRDTFIVYRKPFTDKRYIIANDKKLYLQHEYILKGIK